MLQTILLTALSAQLTYLNPSVTPTPSAPRVPLTRVLPELNTVISVAENNGSQQKILTDDQLLAIKATISPKPEKIQTYDLQKIVDLSGQNIAQTNEIIAPQAPISTPEPTAVPTSIPAVIPTVVTSPVVVTSSSGTISDEALTYLGNCEAGMNPARNSGNGYYGAFQFSYGTWKSMNTGYERADLAPIDVQMAAVRQLLQRSSIYNQFPGCARKMHSAGLI
ncbi:MAG TPA: transglycosylase family protein [Candidatus Acidoferrales bacterium]|nr:transglycosylase family protein [Candidatus Acidoferrales bacterium]